MPELPEVQTVVDDLTAAGLIGLAIRSVQVRRQSSVATHRPAAFAAGLKDRTIQALSRRGKYIIVQLSAGKWLVVHLRMTGSFHLEAGDGRADPHDRVVLRLSDGRCLYFHDPRAFGRWRLVDDPAAVVGGLGPEPLEAQFTPARLAGALRSHRRMLKPLLLDQTFVAGLGNIYVDEALWEARLHPCRSSSGLCEAEARRLYRAIRLVLRRGIANLGTTLGRGEANFYSVGRRRGRNADGLRVFRRTGEPCPRCGSRILRIVVGQRSTHLCPGCQRGGGLTNRSVLLTLRPTRVTS